MKPEEKQLTSGYYFSPGYYLKYWKHAIIGNFSADIIYSNVKLKPHREVWIGAHLAALKTKLSGIPFFVGIPETEPPDVLIAAFEPTVTRTGKIGHNLNFYPVEITRCSAADGENLFDQIARKNTSAYSDTIVVVYMYGFHVMPDVRAISTELCALSKVYPHEIIAMVELQANGTDLDQGSFGFLQIYPGFEHTKLNRGDVSAYFDDPNIMTTTGRGIQSKFEHLGEIMLMPPEITVK